MTPFFSIIIPVYNVAPYLCECLDSVRAQIFTDWEAICVDDGSMDGSGAILDEYTTKDKRIRVMHQENAGVGSARNLGLRNVAGDWICFLDSDDIWNCYLLKTIYGAIQSHPSENLFRFGYEKFKGDNEWNKRETEQQCTFEVIDISHEISMRDFSFFLFWCYVYRRDSIKGIEFPGYIRGEDRYFLNKVQLERVNRIIATNALLYGYRKRSGSATNTVPSRRVLCDEMDHRLDIMEMIDASHKRVMYSGSVWLEDYFTTKSYYMISKRIEDKKECLSDWYARLRRFSCVEGVSRRGRFVVKSCLFLRFRIWHFLVCYAIPQLLIGVSPFRCLKRKIKKCIINFLQ